MGYSRMWGWIHAPNGVLSLHLNSWCQVGYWHIFWKRTINNSFVTWIQELHGKGLAMEKAKSAMYRENENPAPQSTSKKFNLRLMIKVKYLI